MQDLQDVRLSLIHTAEWLVMAAALSQERTAQRLTVQLHMLPDTLQRTLLLQDLQTDVKYSFHMQSVLHSLLQSWLIHLEQAKLQTLRLLKQYVRTLTFVLQELSRCLTFVALFTRPQQLTDTSDVQTLSFHGKN